MNWRALFRHGHSEPRVGEPAGPGSAEPDFHDPYAEKRRRALELLGERYVLHPTKALHRWSSETGSTRGFRSTPH